MGNLSISALLVALSGIVIVFIMLAVLCMIIPLISKAVQSTQKPAVRERVSSPPPQRPAPPPRPAATPAAAPSGPSLIGVDEKTAACIMAIVSHETGIPLSELNFQRIQAI